MARGRIILFVLDDRRIRVYLLNKYYTFYILEYFDGIRNYKPYPITL